MSKNIAINQLQFGDISKKILPLIRQYGGFIFLVALLFTYTFLVFKIGILVKSEPSDDTVLEQVDTVKRLKVDQGSIDKILQLKDQNIGVQSLFETARDNPFEDQ